MMEPMALPVSSLYFGLHGLLAVFLANFVLYVRLRASEMPEWSPAAALRVQANFIENVPLALLLLLVLDIQGGPSTMIHSFGILLLFFRLMHAFGLGTKEGANYPRLIGAQGTFVLLSIMSFACVGMFFNLF
ncbi:MAG: hypothetical protein CMQ40_05705 [Gammaproteobacteria bacterium]|nr:hypothetical protein [Gammaproteobacteria bacterium]